MGRVNTLPQSRPIMRADFEQLPIPDDGHRYELIDGNLIVSPTPTWRHQDIVVALASTLRASCPPDLKVLVAPVDVVLDDSSVVEPDVVVVRRSDLGERMVEAPPVLAVEVLSPSTRRSICYSNGNGTSAPRRPPTGSSTQTDQR